MARCGDAFRDPDWGQARTPATIDDVRALASRLPRSYEALVRDQVKFLMPPKSDLRYHRVRARLSSISEAEMREFGIDACRMVVAKRVAAEYFASDRVPPG
ncbi:MAG: hypothetical protein ACYDB7_10590 [Mycobacteriales bacterium]